jgi:glycosyltransferase involved in cell wall biosynthesis
MVPVFNGRAYLGEALTSILGQTRLPGEVIVVDDGSTDGTLEVVADFHGVRIVRQEHAGQAAALNRGVREASGSFLAFLDADDRWLPDKLERQLEAFEEDPSLELVFGHARQFVEPTVGTVDDDRTRRLASSIAPDREVLPARLPSAVMVRRSTFERVGPFSLSHSLGSVIEWSARCDDAGVRQRRLEHVVYERRIHGSNTGVERSGERGEYAKMLKAVLDRRRQGESRRDV